MERVIKLFTLFLILSVAFATYSMAEEVVGASPSITECTELNEKLEPEIVEYLLEQCSENGIEFPMALAIIEVESEFNPKAYNKKSVDRGLMQVNKSWVGEFKKLGWITQAEDLYDQKTNIRCGIYIFKQAVDLYGNTERAYAYYNTGKTTVKSNKASRKVMSAYERWKERLM